MPNSADGLTAEAVFETAVDFAEEGLGLDPGRMGFISTDLMAPLVPAVTAPGVAEDRIRLRSLEEAQAAGDGSGYFDPPGHPDQRGLLTASLRYRVDPTGTEPLGHPTGAGWTEIGEMILNVGPQAGDEKTAWVFGL